MSSQSDDETVLIDRDDVSNYNPKQILPEPPEVIQKLRAWLKPTSYDLESSEYRKHLSSHARGTGHWLRTGDSYKDWLQSEDTGLLWIKGIPGSGKSVLASSIIKEISANDQGSPVLYFFFRQIIDANHEPVALLRDWLDQILVYSPPLQKKLKGHVVKEGYGHETRSLDTMSMQELWDNLRLAFSGLPGRVYCVADALDEMDRGNDAFLQALAELGSWNPSKVKVLITSRPVPAVEGPLRHAKCTQIRLHENMVDADISTFVRRGLENTDICHGDQQLIQKAIPGRANGLLLYAKLAMDAFLEPGANIKAVLDALPADMNQMYTDLLHEHSHRSGVPDAIQRLILQWVTHATRPLRLIELAEMTNVTYNIDTDRDLRSTKGLVRAACGPLLEILPDETVCVIHHSFTEYLKGMTRSPNDDGYPVLLFGETHASLGSACLAYLLSGVFDEAQEAKDTEDIELKLKYPFLAYALNSWHVHVARSTAAGYDQTDFNLTLDKLMRDPDSIETWTKLQRFTVGYANSGITPLHVAAMHGLTAYARQLLLSPEVSVHAVDVHGKTPLWWAASSGMFDVVQVLIDAGANPDQAETDSGRKPLHEAASKNHPKVIKVLLDCGVDPLTEKIDVYPRFWFRNASRLLRDTPLMYACQNGHLEALEAFMPFLKDQESVHQALSWSAGAGRNDLVQRILQHPGVDINRQVRGATPLFMASLWSQAKTIRLLLNEGADPKIRCDFHDEFSGMSYMSPSCFSNSDDDGQSRVVSLTALFSALDCSRGRTAPKGEREELKSLLELFIDKGADIHDRSPCGNSLLHITVSNPVWLRILLDAGVDANVANNDGFTATHQTMSVECLSVLVKTGKADINKRATSNGKTPLLSLCEYRNRKETTLKLIEYGADCTIVDKDGNGPLHIVLQSDNPRPEVMEVIEALLSAGADLNLRNKFGQTPLDVMFSGRSPVYDLIDLVTRAGADINTRDSKNGATLLFRALSTYDTCIRPVKDFRDAITSLLERGALLECRDYEGRTLLHEIVKSQATRTFLRPEQGTSRFEVLVSLGLDIHVADYQGNTLLHELCSQINTAYYAGDTLAILEMLLSLGIDADRPNNRGRIPLHRLCIKAESRRGDMDIDGSILDLVISQTKDINFRDRDGISPLHLAVTVSEFSTKKLLDAGADPTIETFEGLTPLHLAARSRRGNIVGMLLDALHRLDSDQPPSSQMTQGAWLKRTSNGAITGVNAEANGTTPLYYACLSGRPEIVSMLFDAGADAKGRNLRSAITGFEEELELWRRKTHHDAENGDCGGLTKGDLTRPYAGTVSNGRNKYHNGRYHGDPLQVNDTARLEEIIETVLDHGGDLTGEPFAMRSEGSGSLTDTTSDCRDYTLKCLSDAIKKRPLENLKASSGFEPRAPTFDEKLIPRRCEAIYKALGEPGVVEPGRANEDLFITRLRRREYDVVEELAKLGVDFLAPHTNHGPGNLGTLVEGGFTSLVKRIGLLLAQEQVDKGNWPAPGDGTQPVFGHNRTWTWTHDGHKHNLNDDRQPFLLRAVQQEVPIFDMVRLLVEEFGVDIDALHGTNRYDQFDGRYKLDSPGDSALHLLAQGYHWWHTAQALPYLISKGANLEVKNSGGRTPLHIAMSAEGRLGPFRKDVARQLVLGGADINATDDAGRSCLYYAAGDVEMTRLLVEHGATIHADAVFGAINEKQPEALDILLSAGVDANIRFERDNKKPLKIQQGKFLQSWEIRNMPDAEWYPLHHVAARVGGFAYSQRDKEARRAACLRLINVLLSHGANPFARFSKCPGEECYHLNMDYSCAEDLYGPSRPTADPRYSFEPHLHEDCVVLHQLIVYGHIVQPFLELPNIDANHRDGSGRTLLHASCSSRRGPDVPLSLVAWDSWDPKTSTETSLFRHLISLGADVGARDDLGQNVLHHMFRCLPDRFCDLPAIDKSLAYSLENHPSIINQKDKDGKTPLYLAIERVICERRTTAADALLGAGADPLIADNEGNTVLHSLSRMLWVSSMQPLFKKLIELGCDVNARNLKGETPLFWYYAGFRDDWDEFRMHNRDLDEGNEDVYDEEGGIAAFEAAGADFGALDNAGQSILHVAAKGHALRFKTLTTRGLDPMLEDNGSKTAVDVAATCGNKGVLRLFKRVGAGGDDEDEGDDEPIDLKAVFWVDPLYFC